MFVVSPGVQVLESTNQDWGKKDPFCIKNLFLKLSAYKRCRHCLYQHKTSNIFANGEHFEVFIKLTFSFDNISKITNPLY